MGLLDYIFPKFCVGCKKLGDYLCPDCFTKISFDVEQICSVCNRMAINGFTHPGCKGRYTINGAVASVVYAGMAKRLISVFKYKPYLTDLRHVLGDLFYEGIVQQELVNEILKKNSIIVPLPLHPDKFRERGYNQAELLAKDLGKKLNIPVYSILKRIKKTQTQTTLKREERKENIKNAFVMDEAIFNKAVNTNIAVQQYKNKMVGKVPTQVKLSNKQIVKIQVFLVDDVITSGATMLEAANVLKRAGAGKVWGLALAHGK